jgi:VWFA-related protein
LRILAGFCLAAIATPQPATFHAGTRLVQVEVVVRSKSTGFSAGHPVTGLTREDFTVLDEGKPQRIDVFRSGQASSQTVMARLTPGAVSNRVNRLGESLPSATVVLFDRLNTRFGLKAYESKGVLQLLRSLRPQDRAAIYLLGKNLHVLQDLTDDPEKLLAAITHLDSGRDLMPANIQDALFDLPVDMMGQIDAGGKTQNAFDLRMQGNSIESEAEISARVYAANNDATTMEALRRIVQHLSGIPGRRNLIWVKEEPMVPGPVMGMLLQAKIALYPVLIRSVEYGAPDLMATQHAVRDLAAVTGGTGFDDAGDLPLALKTAEEDSGSAYTLGYYPSEEVLDGKYHRLTVTVAGGKSAHLEVRYRPGYLATKQELAMTALPRPDMIAELFENPLDDTAIGITARTEPDPRPGRYQVRLTVDLHDVHLERAGPAWVGKVEVAFPFENGPRVSTIGINLTDEQMAQFLERGLVIDATGIEASGDAIRVVVRDPSTGVAGSLRIPVKK